MGPDALISEIASIGDPSFSFADHEDLVHALDTGAQRIIQLHIEAMRREMHNAVKGLSDEQIADDLPDVLADATVLLRGDSGGERRLKLRSPAHGTARYGQGFEVSDLGREYSLLRHVTTDQVRRHLGRTLSGRESDVLHGVIDFITGHTTTAFVRQKEDELRLQTDSISRFLSSMAHDLRNDVNGALLALQSAEMIVTDIASPSADDGLSAITQELTEARQTMERTITSMTRLLNSEKLRAREDRANHIDVSLHAMLQSVSRSVARNLGSRVSDARRAGTPATEELCDRGVQIHVDCPDNAVAHTDPELLSTILMNLVGNAVKYGNDCDVTLRAGRQADTWRVDVIDKGAGIEPARLQHLFRQFDRAGRTDGDGVGLGLSIARRAADLINAELTVQSEVGHGSTFTVVVPAGTPM